MTNRKFISVILTVSIISAASIASSLSMTASADDNIRGTVYFDSTGPLDGAQRNTYYCYMWGSDGTGSIGEWNTKSLKMNKVEGQEKLYSYDVPKTNSNGDIVNADLVIFSALGKGQTYDTTFSDSCLGDTAYVVEGEILENPVDSAQVAVACAWRNNPQEGAHICITSTGRVQGVGILTTETPESIADAFIQKYNDGMAQGLTGYDNPELVTGEARQNYINQINAIIAGHERPTDPPEQPTDAPTQQEAPSEAPTQTPTQNPTQASTEAQTIATLPTAASASDGTTISHTSEAGGTGSAGTTGTTGGNTQSGKTVDTAESTAAAVLGSVLLAAAGVAFIARKKREI